MKCRIWKSCKTYFYRLNPLESRNQQKFGRFCSISFDSKSFFLKRFFILFPKEALYIVNTYIVKWNNYYDS